MLSTLPMSMNNMGILQERAYHIITAV